MSETMTEPRWIEVSINTETGDQTQRLRCPECRAGVLQALFIDTQRSYGTYSGKPHDTIRVQMRCGSEGWDPVLKLLPCFGEFMALIRGGDLTGVRAALMDWRGLYGTATLRAT